SVDEAMRVQLSMADRQFGRLTGGQILEISPAKVPQLIGRDGSMVNLIREFTNVRMFVGQNGRIWIDGDPEGVFHAAHVIKLIDDSGPAPGLTDAVRAYLEAAYGRRATTPAERDDDGRH
ncbi:MAG TPA: KH domain-containing protein, partial [Thermoplasmata archaeon]|nr:KH domain-containing protein [Thermoplasmata archaeon]